MFSFLLHSCHNFFQIIVDLNIHLRDLSTQFDIFPIYIVLNDYKYLSETFAVWLIPYTGSQ